MGDGGAGRSGPGLRARLVTFFVLITAVPVLIASVVLQTQIDARVQARAASELGTVARGALSLLDAARTRAGDLAVDLSVALVVDHLAPLRAGAGAAQEWLAARVEPGERADAVLLVDADGQVLGSVSRPPQFAAQTPLDVEALVDAALTERVPPGVLLAANEVRGRFSDGPQRRFGWVIAARWTDQTLLEELGVVGNAALRAADGDVLAAVGARSDDLDATEATLGELTLSTVGDRSVYTVAESLAPAGGDPAASIVVWSQRPGAQSLIGISALVVLPVVLLGGAAAWLLAGTVTAPVREPQTRHAPPPQATLTGDCHRQAAPSCGTSPCRSTPWRASSTAGCRSCHAAGTSCAAPSIASATRSRPAWTSTACSRSSSSRRLTRWAPTGRSSLCSPRSATHCSPRSAAASTPPRPRSRSAPAAREPSRAPVGRCVSPTKPAPCRHRRPASPPTAPRSPCRCLAVAAPSASSRCGATPSTAPSSRRTWTPWAASRRRRPWR